MRFIENGPAIPDNLLFARDEGRVAFFCGAGVSRAKAGLADFYGLADSVLNKLHVSADHATRKVLDEAREIGQRTGTSGLISADRIFGLLEREFLVQDIEEAVANALKPTENVDLSAHRIMLDLATTAEGKLKLVTTNFDRLFETTLKKSSANNIKILHPPHLPDLARAGEFDGIIHLHGIVNENYNSAEGEGFILSSSEFGRAYLTEGWATEFFREILSQYAVVFIGYGAEDPPVQYLLEAMNKKQGQLAEVYAFQDGAEHEAIGKWFHKGVEAIAYANSDDHRALWDSLAAWAKRAQSPQSWYQEIIDLAKKGPEGLRPFQRGQVAHVVSTIEGARKFSMGDELPSAEWLCVFDPFVRYELPENIREKYVPGEIIDSFQLYGLDSDETPQQIDPDDHYKKREVPNSAWDAFAASKRDRQHLQEQNFPAFRGHWGINPARLPSRLDFLGSWLIKVADQQTAVWWAAKQLGLHPDIQHDILREIFHKPKEIRPVIRQAWRYLFESWSNISEYNQVALEWHYLKKTINKDGWTNQTLREYAALQRPFLKIKQNLWCKQKPLEYLKGTRLTDLLNIAVEYPKQDHNIQIPDEWLAASIRALRQNLEHALQLENEINDYSLYLHVIGSISPDNHPDVDQHSRTIGLYGYIVHFSKLFERLVDLDNATAQLEFLAWPVNDQSIFDHLRIWANCLPDLVSEQSFASFILELGDELFWSLRSQRDLLLALSKRWNQLPEASRIELESRLLSGRPRWENETDQEFIERNAWVTLNRLHWLAEQGCHFNFDLQAETKRLQQYVPDWTPERAKNAAESMGSRGGIVGYNEEHSALLAESLDTILSKTLELGGRTENFLIENTPYAGLCKAKPIRAFSVLTHHAKRDEFPEWAWKQFFYSPKREDDKPIFSALIAERIANYPSENLIEIVYPITQWLKNASKKLADNFHSTYLRILEKLITLIELHSSDIQPPIIRSNKQAEWSSEAINSPVGHIVQVLFSDPRLNQLNDDEKFPKDWVRQIERLFMLPNDLHRYALVILARYLSWFYYRDANWTESILLNVLTSDDSDDIEAFWNGFLWANQIPKKMLYMRLKPGMLNLAKAGNFKKLELERPLAGIILAGWGSFHEETSERCITDGELHDVILHADDEFRCHLIWQLEQFCDKDETWQTLLPKLFRDVWPKQKSAKTPRVSAELFDLVFSKAERFNEIMELVLPLLTSTKQHYFDSSSVDGILDSYPDRALAIFYKAFIDLVPSDFPYNFEQALDRIAIANNRLKADPQWLELKSKLNGI